MEQLKPIIYRVSAFARSGDRAVQPFLVEISAPEDTREGDSVCSVCCPYLRAKPFSIFGVDHLQALELSRRFIESNLNHMNVCLVDADGNFVELPSVHN